MKKIFILIPLLTACVQDASETAANASLSQVDVLEQEIKKDCPTVNYDKKMSALRDSIKTQLATCEAQKATLQEKNNTLLAILIGLIAVIVVSNWAKLKARFIK